MPDLKAALIALLNLVLDYKDDPIVDITHKNPFSIDDNYEGKTIVMDIRAKTDRGEHIDIEMQIGNLTYYVDRTMYYGCRQISESLAEGDDYGKIEKSIVISFVKGKLFPPEVPMHSTYVMLETGMHRALTDKLELHYIELDKIQYDDRNPEELSSLEQLGAYLKCSGDPDAGDYVEELVTAGDEVIEMTDKVLKKISEEERMRELRLTREKMEMLMAMEKRSGYEEGKDEGFNEGLSQGLSQGIARRNREIAANFKASGIPIDIIAANTGLSEEEIAKL